jgi:AcrR family transcriptional regulator
MTGTSATSAERFPRRTARRENTRKRIIKAAARLFQRIGYGSTTMNAIADAADVHVTTLFTHFKSKQDLASCTNDATLERLQRLIAASVGEVPFFIFFRKIVLDFASRLEGERDPDVTVWSELERDPDLALAWATYEHRQVMMLADYVAAEYGLRADDYRPMLVSSLMVSASWEAHRRWSGDTKRLNLERETLVALDIAEAMARSTLALKPSAAQTSRARRARKT